MAINIMLLDDHAVVREGLQALLAAQQDLRVVGSFGNSADAVRFAAESPPDVAILDITLDGLDGIEAAKRIHDLCPGTQILMLSMHASPEFVFQSLRAGATGYVLKESAGDELVAAVRAVHGGTRFLSEKIPAKTLDAYMNERAPDHPLERLSPRELQVLKLIVDGSTSNEVAALLGVSPKSVDTYRSRLMAKLAIDDMPSLVKFAIRHGMTSV
jgi:DNA-binding NarL/FixJ family response regulator